MAEALTCSQLVTAQRLLDGGQTLHQIAGRFGVSFEAACLGLFGGNQSTAARKDVPLNSPADGSADSRPIAEEPSNAVTHLREATGPLGAGTQAPPVDTHPEAKATEDNAATAERGSEATAGRELQVGGDEPRPSSATSEMMDVTAGETAPVFVQRYRLVSDRGEALHSNERVLTRLPKFFWRGDAAAVAALRRRKPQWSKLRADEVLS